MPSAATPVMHLYLHSEQAIFRARVNMVTVTYPVTALVFDTVTLGAFGDIAADMTLILGTAEGLDDLGRVRVQNVATSTTIPIGRVSQGTEDGTLNVSDNMYIGVLEDYRVWAKLPYISPAGVTYKDGDVALGTYTTQIPPVANCGPGFADYINAGTGLITVAFDGSASYAMADGATITAYAWDLKGGTVTAGSLTSATVTATFTAGFRWIALTVTDSNSKPHTTRCPVLAVNPAADVTVENFQIESHRITQQGQTIGFRILEDVPRTTYRDGCLAIYWWDAPASAADRTFIKLIGWHQSDSVNMRAQQTGLLRDTVLHCVDVAGRLAALPGFPQALERVTPATTWEHMPGLTIDKCQHYLAFWHSTALSLADFIRSGIGNNYPAMRLDSTGASLYEQINGRAKSMVPDHFLTCNTLGQLRVIADWMLKDVADRPAATATITEDYWSDIRFEYNRPPKVHVLRGSAVVASTTWTVSDGENTLPLAFCIAPGDAFSQGTAESVHGEQLAISQAALNACTGHRYARINPRYGPFSISEPSGSISVWGYEPANMARVTLNISAAVAAQRGLDFTTANGLVKAIDLRYNHTKQGTWISPTLTWEKETVGLPAVTVTPVIPEEPDYEIPAPWTPPVDGDTRYYYGDMKGYVLWDGAHVMRTWDIQASSPTWALIDTGITGTIYDGQYVHVNATTVGMWLLTSTAVWWCADIMATTPSWTAVLPIATVQASDVAPVAGLSVFACMYNYASEPGYLIVATQPDVTDTAYLHAYFWHTHDYGTSWTQVDMSSFTFGSGATERCYSKAGRFAMNIFRSSPGTIWCVRQTDRTGASTGSTAVFKSEDLGHTWTKHLMADTYTNNNAGGSLLNPFPGIGDPSYIMRPSGTSGPPLLYRTTNAWTTPTTLTLPTGYDEAKSIYRLNKRTFDNTHVMAWHHLTAGGATATHLLESFDQGVIWAVLHQDNGNHNTPNGWPPDVLQWVMIGSNEGGTVNAKTVRLTLNNFSTLLDKQGNLTTILSNTWVNGLGNGFALPKVSPNV